MGRTLSWINRLVPIAHAVDASARSHYARKEIQQLFEIQPRSAQNLMTVLPIVQIGNVHLVEREALSAFLQALIKSESPSEAFADLRTHSVKPVRRKLTTLSLQEVPADLDNPPEHLTLRPGEMKVQFRTAEELAEAMVYLATILKHDLEAFAARYELVSPGSTEEHKANEAQKADAHYIRSWLGADSTTI